MLKPVQLLTLTVVVRTGSFTDAGRELGYTPSAVAQQVAALERALGVRLVERDPQRIRPTPAAYLLADRSRQALDVLEALEEEAKALARGQLGRLSIGTALDPGTQLVADSLSTLKGAASRLDIRLQHTSAERLLDQVLVGSVDVGVLYDYPAAPRALPAELAVLTLGEAPWQLAMPTGWSTAPALRDLADHDWIVGLDGPSGHRALGVVCAAAGFQPRVRFSPDNRDVVLGLVAAELGIGVVPALAWEAPEAIRLELLHQEGATRRTMAVYLRASSSPVLGAAIRALRATARNS